MRAKHYKVDSQDIPCPYLATPLYLRAKVLAEEIYKGVGPLSKVLTTTFMLLAEKKLVTSHNKVEYFKFNRSLQQTITYPLENAKLIRKSPLDSPMVKIKKTTNLS